MVRSHVRDHPERDGDLYEWRLLDRLRCRVYALLDELCRYEYEQAKLRGAAGIRCNGNQVCVGGTCIVR
jgi:hypothetical protein